MNPKKPQNSVRKTAEDLQIDETFFTALVTFYWKSVRKELAEINKTRIEIQGLGHFDLKYFKTKYKLRDTNAFILYHQKSDTKRSKTILQTLFRKLEVLNRANQLSEKRARDVAEKRNKRKQYVLQAFGSVEESKENS